ncbi:MAG: M20/M25/M40 family metallo-hydrolase [Tissierellales bacterium]|jgi:putative aminopeptidase FrvX|nr:M20/M25/M40 family metallo-hydrolase [Tissierellales bacterium]HCX03992.1 peptidase M42 [Clostridiales bacterium]
MDSKKLIEELSNAYGAPGFEEEVLDVVAKYSEELKIESDTMNNMYLTSNIEEEKPTIMIDSHLDEVAFMVQSIEKNGLIKFVTLGGWIATNVPAHTVMIRNSDNEYIKGIVASKPPHFMTKAEREKQIDINELRIDVGASSREEVIETYKIPLGAPIVPDVRFEMKPKNIMMGKAFDNRLGCAAVIETLVNSSKKDLGINIVGTLSVQEEVGLRGAEVSAKKAKPDLAIVFEASPADEQFKDENSAQAALGKGVQIRHRDSSCIYHPGFIKFAKEIADTNNIKYQEAVRLSGGTNAGKIHLSNNGVPTLALSIPSRYIHTHYNYASLDDYKEAIKLVEKLLEKLNWDEIKKMNNKFYRR